MAEKIKKSIPLIIALILGGLIIAMTSFVPQSVQSDNVAAWATVGPSVSCSVEPVAGALSFGTILVSGVSDADDTATTTFTSNTIGYLKIHDWGDNINSDPGLWNSTSGPDTIVSPNAGEAATAVLAGGTEGYGIIAATTTGDGSGSELTIAQRYNTFYLSGLDPDAVGGLYWGTPTALTIASSSAAMTNRLVVVSHKAAISAATLAGNYKDTIIYTCSTTP